jgi:predicted P-loop ATPase
MTNPSFMNDNSAELPRALDALIKQEHWVIWRWGVRNGKKTKVPYQPANPKRMASSTDPSTWSTYEVAVAAARETKADGIGFCLLDSDIGAFDLDDCRDKETGVVATWAQELVARTGSYAEVTVSGTGLRIIGRASGEKIHRKQKVPGANGATLETYRKAERYIVITGDMLEGIEAGLADLDAVMDEVVTELDAEEKQSKKTKTKTDAANVDELRDIIKNGCGDRFDGDRSRAVWHVVNEMLRRGHLPDKFAAVLLDDDNGISEHVHDQSEPGDYARKQVAKAIKDIDFVRDAKEKPIATNQDNIRVALLKLGVTVRHDRFADRVLLDGLSGFGPVLDDAALNHLWLIFDKLFHFRPTINLTGIVISDAALLNGFHPVVDYLDGLTWDGIKRLDEWLITYAGAADTKYTRAVSALMMIAAVRRVRKPGCKFDEMVVLEQPEQRTLKSTALSILAVRDDWFSDDLPLNVEGKRVIEMIRGRWIIEASELSGLKKADVEHLKAFLSRTIDRARMSYGRLPIEALRQCIIVGTTNQLVYLRDTSGNRRFWPVTVKAFKIDELRLVRDQLWAEAAAREAQGESIRLAEELRPAAASEQQQRLADDPFVAILAAHLGGKQGKIKAIDVWTILDLRGAQLNQDIYKRTSEAMKKIGWKRPNKAGIAKFDGKPMAAYTRGNGRQVITANRDDGRLIVDDGMM